VRPTNLAVDALVRVRGDHAGALASSTSAPSSPGVRVVSPAMTSRVSHGRSRTLADRCSSHTTGHSATEMRLRWDAMSPPTFPRDRASALSAPVFTDLLGIGDTEAFDLGGLLGAIIGVMILLGLYRAALKDKEHPLAR